jgi:hypothetical protein
MVLLKSAALLLGVIATACASPFPNGTNAHSNASAVATSSQEAGFEVVTVYVEPEEGCVSSRCSAAEGGSSSSGSGKSSEPSPAAAISQSADTQQLLPNVHWSVDTSSLANIIPVPVGTGSDFYYGSGDATKAGYFGYLTYYFTSPAVDLDNSVFISSITCISRTSCTIAFASSTAYSHALRTWMDDLILVSYTEVCGSYADGERCYFKVSALDFQTNSLTVQVSGSFSDAATLISLGKTEWGWWTPRYGGTGGSKSSSGPSGSSSAPTGTMSSAGSGRKSTSTSAFASPTQAGNSTGSPNNSTLTTYSNGTNADSFADSNYCEPPIDTKYGLPTACLGALFDQDLDDDLGYVDSLSTNFQDFINLVAPGAEDDGTPPASDETDDFGSAINLDDLPFRRRRRGLRMQERGLFDGLVHAITHPVETFQSVKNFVQEATSISGSIKKDLSFQLPDPANAEASKLQDSSTKQVTSPWGDSILLKAFGDQTKTSSGADGLSGYMNVFCVGCGASGQASVAGRATWTPVGGFTQGQVDLSVDVKFVLKLGIDAQMVYKQEFNNALLRLGLPGLTYGVVTIGPWVEVGTHVIIEAAAHGRILAGAEMGLQGAKATLDFVNQANSNKNGWDPYFKPVFEAEGSILLSATLGLPVGIRCGLQIASFSKSVGLIDEPSITGTAQAAVAAGISSSGGFSAGLTPTDGCTGISTLLSWRNLLYADILGTQYPLLDTGAKPIAQGCIGTPAASSSTTTTSSTTSDTTSTSTTSSDDTASATSSSSDTTTSTTSSDDGTASSTTASADTSTMPTSTAGSDGGDGSSPTTTTADATPTSDAGINGDAPSGKRRRAYLEYGMSPGQEFYEPAHPVKQRDTDVDLTNNIAGSSSLGYSSASSTLSNRPYNSSSGYEYNVLTVPDGSANFLTCGDGAVYALAPDSSQAALCSAMWATRDDTLVADGADRLLHYYANTMSAVGVSRLRVSDEETVPQSAMLVALAPYYGANSDDPSSGVEDLGDATDYYFVAVDADDNIFYPIICAYSDGSSPPKLFLAADPVAGVAMLQSPDVEFSITGGVVSACAALNLQMAQLDSEGGWDVPDNSTSTDSDVLPLTSGGEE